MEEQISPNPFTLMFAGPQGSGKGTQVKLLKEFLQQKDGQDSVFQSETGAHFRSLLKEESMTAGRVRATIDKGDLQPSFLASFMWSGDMVKNLRDNHHVFIDGSPRTIPEAAVLHTAMEFYERTPIVITIDISKEEALKRLMARGRSDDNEGAILHRLNQYYDITIPAIEYLKQFSQYTFVTIKGEQTIKEVHRDILQALDLS